ncbi:MAG: acyltransferase [Firmicutes bacterium]|nr:acyltransferase [Bacillota bacterium]
MDFFISSISFYNQAVFYLEYFVATITGFILLYGFASFNMPPIQVGSIQLLGDFFLLQIFGFPVTSIVGTMWYLSALIGALLILVPVTLKHHSLFLNVLGPFVILSGYGFMAFTYGHMGAILEPLLGGIIHAGLLRAIIDISLGYILYFNVEYVRKVNWSICGQIALTFIEVFCWLCAIALIVTTKQRGMIDFVIVLLFSIGILISFSETSFLHVIFKNKYFNWLGFFSLNIFLNHFYIASLISKLTLNITFQTALSVYILGSLICALFNYLVVYYLKKLSIWARIFSLVINRQV